MSMTDGHLSDGRRIRAFTVVEVIVVMVIVGVATGTVNRTVHWTRVVPDFSKGDGTLQVPGGYKLRS